MTVVCGVCVYACDWIKRSKWTSKQASKHACDSSERMNGATNNSSNKNLISYCSMCLVRYSLFLLLAVVFVVISFLVLLSTQVTFSLYASEQGVCHAIYLICPFIFLHRIHFCAGCCCCCCPEPFFQIAIATKTSDNAIRGELDTIFQ